MGSPVYGRSCSTPPGLGSLTASYRPYWRCYFPNTAAIIYVIDASDHDRLQTSRTELLTMLSEEELRELELDHRKLEPSRAYFLMLPLSEI